jgi:hypothetical protein
MISGIREHVMSRLQELKCARASWEAHWRDLADNILPRRLRLNPAGEFQRGDKQNRSIINTVPLRANRVLAAGLMSAMTSPSRPWRRLTTRDPDLANYGPVKAYLHDVDVRLNWIFSMSNFYQALSDGVYPDLGAFGTAAVLMEESDERVLTCYAMPVGEYYLASNRDGVIDTCYRDVPMTVRQLVDRFCRDGNLSRLSASTRNSYAKGNLLDVVEVVHAIEPSGHFIDGAIGPQGKRWSSTWIEKGAHSDRVLDRDGYHEFPVLAPRWSVTGYDVYGRGPGMDALADCRELQHESKRLGQLIDKAVSPPMKGSPGLRGTRATLAPGELTYLSNEPGATFEPAMVVQPAALTEIRGHISELENRIMSVFFADLWLRILSDERNQRATATEIEEGRQELMLQLGPVLERLNPELLRPAVDRGYGLAERLGVLPDPPPDLQGQELQIEFISILHQAQKATGLMSIRMLWDEAGRIAQYKPAIMDKMEADASVDEIVDILGVKPNLVLSEQDVASVRAVRAKEEREKQDLQTAGAVAQQAGQLGRTPAPAPDNALGALMQAVSPLAQPGGPT